MAQPIHAGWLAKQSKGGLRSTLQNRYFVLTSDMLSYYKTPRDHQPKGVVPLRSPAASCPASPAAG